MPFRFIKVIIIVRTVKRWVKNLNQTVKLTAPYITLGQLLKKLAIVSSGGQAKWYLRDHQVLLNGQPEQRRGKKLYPADHIQIVGIGTIILAMAETDQK